MSKLLCKLCLCTSSSLVDSHIVPRAFYADLRRRELIGVSKGQPERRYKKGIYGKFLCAACEKKFQKIDNDAIKVIKQQSSWKLLHKEGQVEAFVVENAFLLKNTLHDFGLSILWRGAASGRAEFSSLKLGPYEEKLRKAFSASLVCNELRSKTGLLFQDYRNGKNEFNQVFQPYRLFQPNKNFKSSFGNFHCHVFGFPYGEIFVRLGGASPYQGYLACDFAHFKGKAVLWTDNLTPEYPNWFFDAKPNSKTNSLLAQVFSK